MNQIEPLYRFYTFPQPDPKEHLWNIKRITDSKLRQNINNIKRSKPQLIKEEDFAWYFLYLYLDDSGNSEAEIHIKAFLASFSVDIVRQFKKILKRDHQNNSDIFSILQDILQIACKYALNPKIFFRGFQRKERNDYSYYELKKYIKKRMYGLVRDELIKEKQVSQTSNRTDLGLAGKSSQKRVKDALEAQGVTKEQIVKYIGIWNTFQEVRKTSKSDISTLTEEHFQEIARRYSQLSSVQLDGKIIRRDLERIGRAVRYYEYPKTDSLDIPYNPEDSTSLPRVEHIPDTSLGEIWDRFPREEDKEKLRTFLDNQIQELDTKAQSLLLLRHGFQLVQKQIAEEINKDTATVNRRYNTLLTELIEKMREWRNQHWNTNGEESEQDLTSEELKEIKSDIIIFLDDYYFHIIFNLFQQTFNNLSVESKRILDSYYRSYFNQGYSEYNKIDCNSNRVDLNNVLISEDWKLLQAGIAQQIHNHYSLNLKSDGVAWLQLENMEFINQFIAHMDRINSNLIILE
jgi:RNA polymerase sigma factor (sigma-70 family)